MINGLACRESQQASKTFALPALVFFSGLCEGQKTKAGGARGEEEGVRGGRGVNRLPPPPSACLPLSSVHTIKFGFRPQTE